MSGSTPWLNDVREVAIKLSAGVAAPGVLPPRGKIGYERASGRGEQFKDWRRRLPTSEGRRPTRVGGQGEAVRPRAPERDRWTRMACAARGYCARVMTPQLGQS
jgi:hypothetical protein